MTKTAYFLIGASGSGKSTFVQKLAHQQDEIGMFSLDAIRLLFLGAEQFNLTREEKIEVYKAAFEKASEQSAEFNKLVEDIWRMCLQYDVIVLDNTNLTRKTRAQRLQSLRKNDYKIVMVEFIVPLQTVLDRQSTRPDKSVPLEAVRQHYFRQESIHLGSECDEMMVVSGV
jgi:predicted kinase